MNAKEKNVLSCVRESYINLPSLYATAKLLLVVFATSPRHSVFDHQQPTGGKRNEERLFKYFTFTVCTGMLLSSSITTSSSQATTLWQIIYYIGENIQTVNPRLSRIFLIFSAFLPTHVVVYTSAFDCVRIHFQWLYRCFHRKRRKLGKRSKSLR